MPVPELWTTDESARELGMSASGVRLLLRDGKLRAAFRTRAGKALLRPADVERLRFTRERAKSIKHAARLRAAKRKARETGAPALVTQASIEPQAA